MWASCHASALKQVTRTLPLAQGAPELLLARCSAVLLADGSLAPLSMELRTAIGRTIDEMAGAALRCLAFAAKEGSGLGLLKVYDGSPDHPAGRLLADPTVRRSRQGGLLPIHLSHGQAGYSPGFLRVTDPTARTATGVR